MPGLRITGESDESVWRPVKVQYVSAPLVRVNTCAAVPASVAVSVAPRYLFSSPFSSSDWGCWPVGPGMVLSPSR